jgi:hypothetical protein
MSIVTLEGIIEKGQIRLKSELKLPGKTQINVVIHNMHVENAAQIFSPRLADPSQSNDFKIGVLNFD